jgi:hypothetical protein
MIELPSLEAAGCHDWIECDREVKERRQHLSLNMDPHLEQILELLEISKTRSSNGEPSRSCRRAGIPQAAEISMPAPLKFRRKKAAINK